MNIPHKPRTPTEAWLRDQLKHAVDCEGVQDMENPLYGIDRVPCQQCEYIKQWLKQHPLERKA